MPITYHHTPLIFYSPNFIAPNTFNNFGTQCDVFPTLMGYLNIPYINNTFGIDLRKDTRPYAYFTADNKIGVINNDYFLVIRKNDKETLYKYKQKDLNNYLADNKQLSDSMKIYAYSMLQTAKWIIDNKKTGMQEK